MKDDYNKDPFEEYIKDIEASKLEKSYAWYTAIGLQAVDGLTPSEYLIETAKKDIEGKIPSESVPTLIESYYKEKSSKTENDRTEEADKVAARIAGILSEKAFSFTIPQYLSIHEKLFKGIYSHAGKIRDYNITKSEWILDGDTIHYGGASELRATLEYDFNLEKNYSYKDLSIEEIISHLCRFVANLWQIHVFGEGNTRTTAVFFIKYLRTLGFSVTNDIFAKNAWYFRNALVRANYNNLQLGIRETTEYLELFMKNLLLNENNQLSNRSMHIHSLQVDQKVDIEAEKVDIATEKVDIEAKKVDICERYGLNDSGFSKKTIGHIQMLYHEYGDDRYFGRSDLSELLGLKSSSSSALIKKLLAFHVIETVKGHGKGKYKFKK